MDDLGSSAPSLDDEPVEPSGSTGSNDSIAVNPLEAFDGESIVQDEIVVEARQEALHLATSFAAWTAPLPRPEDFREYHQIRPSLAEAIEFNFRTQSEHAIALATREQGFVEREIALAERNMTIRENESSSDISTRNRNQIFGMFFVVLVVILGFIDAMWGTENGWVRAAIVIAFLSPIVIIPGIMMLRGRMTSHEQKAISSAAPHLGRATSRIKQIRAGEEE